MSGRKSFAELLAASARLYTSSLAGGRQRLTAEKFDDFVSIRDFPSADGGKPGRGGATDDLAAFNAMKAALPNGGTVNIPNGSYVLSDTFTYNGTTLSLIGSGEVPTSIWFSPGATKAAIVIDAGTANGSQFGRIESVAFLSSDNSTKTAIKLVNVKNYRLRHINVTASTWAGADSIGVQTTGRQLVVIEKCDINCARPLVFSPNVYAGLATLATDHYKIRDCELISSSSTHSVIEFENGVSISNATISGVALVGGLHGVLATNDGTVNGIGAAASYHFSVEHVRVEQGPDATGYSFKYDFTGGGAIQNLSFFDVRCDLVRNGIYLRNAKVVSIEQVTFPGAGHTDLDFTMISGSRLEIRNCYNMTGTKTITNGLCIWRSPDNGAFGTSEIWVYDGGATRGTQQSDVWLGGLVQSVAQNTDQAASATNLVPICSNLISGQIQVVTDEHVTMRINLQGSANTVAISSDTAGFASVTANTANKWCFFSRAWTRAELDALGKTDTSAYPATNYFTMQNTKAAAHNAAILKFGNIL